MKKNMRMLRKNYKDMLTKKNLFILCVIYIIVAVMDEISVLTKIELAVVLTAVLFLQKLIDREKDWKANLLCSPYFLMMGMMIIIFLTLSVPLEIKIVSLYCGGLFEWNKHEKVYNDDVEDYYESQS